MTNVPPSSHNCRTVVSLNNSCWWIVPVALKENTAFYFTSLNVELFHCKNPDISHENGRGTGLFTLQFITIRISDHVIRFFNVNVSWWIHTQNVSTNARHSYSLLVVVYHTYTHDVYVLRRWCCILHFEQFCCIDICIFSVYMLQFVLSFVYLINGNFYLLSEVRIA